MIKQITVLHFSPTGGTRRAALLLAKGIAEQIQEIDLTQQQAPVCRFGAGDIVLAAAPVYGGRLPAFLTERLHACCGGGARAVAAAVYGGRAYEDALLEMGDLLAAQNFRVIASAALLAEHSIFHPLAAGRPDAQDAAQLAAFGARIADKLTAGEVAPPSVPGAHPYKSWGGMAAVPFATEDCTACGLCVRQCPAQAIAPDTPRETDAVRCIRCMRCVSQCPHQVRGLPAEVSAMLGKKLSPLLDERKENELYL